MNPTGGGDALALGQRLVQVIEIGRKTSTYKLATLVALLDLAVEQLPDDPAAALRISLHDLADRIIDLYWPQTRPYLEVGMLRQNTQAGRGIPDMVADLRSRVHPGRTNLTALREDGDRRYLTIRGEIAVRVAEMPLTHLQVVPGGTTEPFLYDEPWLAPSTTQSRRSLDAHGWSITLLPGVAFDLASLSGLLRPVLQLAWEALVVRLNDGLDRDDLAAFLFGTQRATLAPLGPRLAEAQGFRCFYCERRLTRTDVHVDHVLPWSRIPLDGAANLVAADSRCNLAKSNALPVADHHERALARGQVQLGELAAGIVPVLLEATRRAGNALYRTSSKGTPLWQQPGVYRPLT